MAEYSTVLILTLPESPSVKGYVLSLVAEEWKARGIRVLMHHDLSSFVPADICFIHVDRSVVPPEHIEFARRYPVAINLGITDIRKRNYSRNRVVYGDEYDGPVIVKSSLNYAGEPERRGQSQWLRSAWGKFNRAFTRVAPASFPFQQPSIRCKQHYLIFPKLCMLPRGWLDRDDIVVERFRPERYGEDFVLREWYFLGDREVYHCEISKDPIFTTGTRCLELAAPPPDAIRQVRKDLNLDYGKIDYAIDCDGFPVLFDVNKTTGVANPDSATSREYARTLADGLNYWQRQRGKQPETKEQPVG